MNYKVHHGDCLELTPKLAEKHGGFDFIFVDPPFNIGQKYPGYEDNLSDYSITLRHQMQKIYLASKESGVICFHGPDSLLNDYLEFENDFSVKRIAWIIWHYRFGQHNSSNWINAHCHCLVYAKFPYRHTWNPKSVLVESDRASKYNDKRTRETRHPGKRLPGTVWGVPSDGQFWGRVQGNNAERQPECPNQLPEVYLERLIKAYTNPGDLVYDPFAGSGTTATVAVALSRRAVTVDISEVNVEIVKQRILRGAVRVK